MDTSKHDSSTQCLSNVGPTSTTMAQHWSNIGRWVVFTGMRLDPAGCIPGCTMEEATVSLPAIPSSGLYLCTAVYTSTLAISRHTLLQIERSTAVQPVSLHIPILAHSRPSDCEHMLYIVSDDLPFFTANVIWFSSCGLSYLWLTDNKLYRVVPVKLIKDKMSIMPTYCGTSWSEQG